MMPQRAKAIELKDWDNADLPPVWGWILSYPEYILHDYGAKTLGEFVEQEIRRESINKGVYQNGILIGLLICEHITPLLCEVHVYFRKGVEVWAAVQAMREGVEQCWQKGYKKITAPVFANNKPIQAVLKRLGAVQEGYFVGHTTQKGMPIDVAYFSFFRR